MKVKIQAPDFRGTMGTSATLSHESPPPHDKRQRLETKIKAAGTYNLQILLALVHNL